MNSQLVIAIKKLADSVGYADCGCAPANDFVEFKKAVEERMRRFPDAAQLYANLLSRSAPRTRAPWAKSIVVCVRRYGKYVIPPGLVGRIGRTYLFDRRNPNCPDHDMPKKMKQGLKQLGLRVKQGGIPDRWAGARAGLTSFGRNCFAYSRKHGSWINIETWLVDTELPPGDSCPAIACPEGCRACMDACPTKALIEPFVMRMDRCIAYLTYAAPEPIAPELWNRMGKWIYGCDICQQVCPLNKGKWKESEKAPWLEAIAPQLQSDTLMTMDEDTFRTIIEPAFWYIPQDNIARWHANAKRAMIENEENNEKDQKD